MIETISQMHLAIAALLMAAAGLVSAGLAASIYFILERIFPSLGDRRDETSQRVEAASEKSKIARAS